MNQHETISYIELPAKDLEATKIFFTQVFLWTFTDYGPEYSSFSHHDINGGFYQSELSASTELGSALIVFYSRDLEGTQTKIEDNGGIIIKPTFSFPGGRRFHFSDPSGNEFAVWSEADV
ncbi:MAG: VOC family protein [Gammaproteobacteria bacterium]|jgi:hypothetical protein|nr:VOC family protein [Gammaproteobacteria bacterium]MBT3489616.1 VOC family protein [Gammaproteobacteria bacterium]MBT3719100.1 VOC family protein [Gammaproteobacteria bacterium]MBT3843947.1 VOC family protein [Gammaproteobacteria bacterium]MBT3893429.1 VOC family protein [Gammaproteobacteria bacterium]